MAIISLPGAMELVILAALVIYWYVIIRTVKSIIKRVDFTLSNRLLWILIILVAPLIGIFLYNVYGQPAAKA